MEVVGVDTLLAAARAAGQGSPFLLLVIVAIVLAMAALWATIGVLGALTGGLLRALWPSIRALLLLGLALIVVILLVLSRQEGVVEAGNEEPSVGIGEERSDTTRPEPP